MADELEEARQLLVKIRELKETREKKINKVEEYYGKKIAETYLDMYILLKNIGKCPVCEGSGRQKKEDSNGRRFTGTYTIDCRSCDGSGKFEDFVGKNDLDGRTEYRNYKDLLIVNKEE